MVNKRYLKIVGLLMITLISVLGISCHKKEENEFILNAPTLEEKGVYLGESLLKTEYYHATCKESFEIKENYAFKDYVSVCEELSINEITKENLTVLYNGYQLDSLIVNIIPKFFKHTYVPPKSNFCSFCLLSIKSLPLTITPEIIPPEFSHVICKRTCQLTIHINCKLRTQSLFRTVNKFPFI